MPIIPIVSGEDGSVQEWVLVELQGRIEPQSEVDAADALVVGTMTLSKTNKDVVQLQIGYHLLEGRKMPLKKPIVILEGQQQQQQQHQQQPGSSSSGQPPSSSGGEPPNSSGGDGRREPGMACKVIGVLRHKVLFKNRPKALISKPTAGPTSRGG